MKSQTKSTTFWSCTAALLLLLAHAPNSYAAFFAGVVTRVTPDKDGNVFVQMNPAPGETRFTDTPARVTISKNDPGAKSMYAAVLTAVALRTPIRVNVVNPPTFATPQIVVGITVDAPQ